MAHVIIGATGGLGRALAERLAAAGHRLVLVARDEAALTALARTLRDRHGADAVAIPADVADGPDYLCGVVEAADARGGIEGLLLPLGLAVRDRLDTPAATLRRIAEVNLLAVVEAVTVLWPSLVASKGAVVGFGSVTGVRGRSRNFVYGAVKRALQAYFESLRLAGRGSGVRVQLWVVGFLATDAMKDEATPLPKGDPDTLAGRVAAALPGPSAVRWFPGWWRAVALVLRLMPWGVYAKVAGGK